MKWICSTDRLRIVMGYGVRLFRKNTVLTCISYSFLSAQVEGIAEVNVWLQLF